MKGFNKKGVSPVIATILLIALTVAAVGIVAVILTSLTPTSIGKSVLLTLVKVENASSNNEMKVVLKNWGPDDLVSGDLSIEFQLDYAGDMDRGFAKNIDDKGVPLSWVTDNPPTLNNVKVWPWKVGAGADISIIFTGADARNIKLTSISVKDATGKVLFTESNLPEPS